MEWYMPTRLHTGEGCVAAHAAELAELGDVCAIITGRHAAQASGALADAEAALVAAGVESFVWDGVTENPPLAGCAEAGRAAHERGARFVLGIGGGSALDAAKAAAVFAANPGLDEAGFYAKAWERAPLPIALIGTTAGTGREVTKVSVLTDSAGRKHSIHDDRLYPALSFGDARYTASCTRTTALTCGVDVLAHACESYFSKKADEISRAFAVRAVRAATAPMAALAAGETLGDEQLRALYEASILGGLAINTTGTCFPHNVGYYLTENHGVPHGFACAVFLPEMIACACEYDPAYAAEFFSATGLAEAELTELITAALPELDVRMSADEVASALPRWADNASVKNTRAEVGTEMIGAMLERMFVEKEELA